jgi:hypothetical protein
MKRGKGRKRGFYAGAGLLGKKGKKYCSGRT